MPTLLGGTLLGFVLGDRWWWLFFFNTFLLYLILVPLPFTLLTAIITRQRLLWIGNGMVLVVAVVCYGPLLVPSTAAMPGSAAPLTAMSFNMLGSNRNTDAVVHVLRNSNADLIGIQELNPAAAEAIASDLTDVYPYQVLDPQTGVTGMGVISRYPLQVSDVGLTGRWVGTPQLVTMDFADQSVTILHVHATPTTGGGVANIEASVRVREQQAQLLVDFAAANPGPLLILTDFNTGDQSAAYRILAGTFRDVWREGGWGLGHTFPSVPATGSLPTLADPVDVDRIVGWLFRPSSGRCKVVD
ncbi:MAG: hypothetical protein GFH27_549281n340 [Chloroflexi bacterium AL-W]|nr:hypothetical protein [Chloroflexi bacterium AL-N1]NOK66225.1 hypothetical protein [Chloroflexi bacterium AL-N10]NOK73106.1 hypothetical protein [Chloroflexi bacterium AL-N5]NOK80003.1 hypothetical protein [Chloroflexi bacterium AL-W]NOK88141.1 hypothetical protein [Chloroflexi bacterium AL-N15]